MRSQRMRQKGSQNQAFATIFSRWPEALSGVSVRRLLCRGRWGMLLYRPRDGQVSGAAFPRQFQGRSDG
jgi:hypothetical protein